MSGEASIQFVGILGSDPEVKITQTGTPVTLMPVYHRNRVKKNDQWQDGESIRFLVKVWGAMGDNLAENLRKGNLVTVDGDMHMERYTDRNGVEKESLTVTAKRVGVIPKPGGTQHISQDADIEW